MTNLSDLVFNNELTDTDIIITDLSRAEEQLAHFKLVLANENFPNSVNLTIKYHGQGHSKFIVRSIAQALHSGSCGKEIVKINLASHNLNFKDARTLVWGLRPSRYPLDLELNLANNFIRNKGLFKFLELLKHCTRGFKLNLSSNLISCYGVKTLATNLTPNGSYPPGMHVDLSDNGAGNEGLYALLNMLTKHIYGMGIGLRSSGINDKGAFYLASLLTKGAFHCGFHLNLGCNLISDVGLGAIIKAIDLGNGPPNLSIEAYECFVNDHLLYKDLKVALNHHNQRRNLYIGLTLFQSKSWFNFLPIELVIYILIASSVSPLICEPDYFQTRKPLMRECYFLEYVERIIEKRLTLPCQSNENDCKGTVNL